MSRGLGTEQRRVLQALATLGDDWSGLRKIKFVAWGRSSHSRVRPQCAQFSAKPARLEYRTGRTLGVYGNRVVFGHRPT